MSDTLTMTGKIGIVPDQSQTADELAGDAELLILLNKTLTLTRKDTTTVAIPENEGSVEEPSTPPTTVNMENIGQADFMVIKTNNPVVAFFADAEVTIESLLIVHFATPITDLSIGAVADAATAFVTLGRV